MKKTMTTLFMVLALFCAMTTTAFADDTAKITIENTISETGIDLTGKTFDVYKIFDATVSNDDESSAITYTLNSNFEAFFQGLLLSGKTGEDLSDDAESYIHTLETSDKRQDFVAKLEDYISNNSITTSGEISGTVNTANGIQSMSSDDLEPGYYLVLDATEYDDESANSAGMLISIPTQDANSEFTQNGTIALKGSQPSIDKEIWHNDLNTTGGWDSVGDYEIGDTVTFRITATLPSDVRGYDEYIYTITDTWSDGIDFDHTSLKIYSDAALTKEVTGSLHDETLYLDNNSLTLSFNILEIKAINSELENLYIVYTGTINEKAVQALSYETNTVELEYSNDPYNIESFGYAEDTVYSYTFQLEVLKTDTTQVNPLSGATFELWVSPTGEGESDEQVYLKQDDNYSTLYYVQQTGTPDTESGYGCITTDENGKFTIKGLDDALTYVLKEVKAPSGYSAAEDIYFKITADYTNITAPVITASSTVTVIDGVLSTTVINTSSELFPGTGGMGTTMFMIAGCGLMAAAAFMLISNRKRHN